MTTEEIRQKGILIMSMISEGIKPKEAKKNE